MKPFDQSNAETRKEYKVALKKQLKFWAGILLVAVLVLSSAFPVMAAVKTKTIRKTWIVEKGEIPTYRFKLKTRYTVTVSAKRLTPAGSGIKDSAVCGFVLFNESKSRIEIDKFFYAKKKKGFKQTVTLYPGVYTLDADCDVKCKIKLKAVPKPGLSRQKATLKTGRSKKLKLYGATGTVRWKSSNKRVATVTDKGIVSAKKKGTCVITAKVKGGRAYRCKITVK